MNPGRPHRLARPRSLRGRLVLALLALAAAALVALDAVVYGALRGYLTANTDVTLRAVRGRVAHQLAEPGADTKLGNDVRLLGASEFYLQLRRPDGTARELVPRLRDPADAAPDLTGPLPKPGRGTPVTVGPARSGGPDYRLLTARVPGRGTLIVAMPLDQVRGTLRRLLVVECAATGGALVLLAGAGLWVLRRGLRPLEAMAADADAIAAGDRTGKVAPADADTEVGRLGLALNTMLAGQRATQDRLRRFVADASHELRTPLTAVLGYADLHHQGVLALPGQRDRAMHGITAEALRMRRLVDDLLLLARLDAVPAREREDADLAAIARDAASAARVVAPDRPLTLDAGPGAVVRGDPEQLRRVVDNLLANVRKHTPDGTPARVTVCLTDNGTQALLTVEDSGPGIAADVLPRVCDRFYRAAPAHSGEGSGLGLAIVAAVAGAHGGTVEVTSPPGEGTRVRVRLPVRR
ncbi:two-component system OmpR family sensor kinase [Streptomyces sp. KhCrAH-43]|uniref:sensor histidine kinase n=1 Tax=unclassified Streptomyces TaxID=2593676 RepID=UPI000366E901|nr:HAMP domain-containing sensor histidine kinase [Streptomyces sp. KhCrAH-43]MYS38301.1 HAMP domain-containing protein [Streptomyces sp. SID4920]MYX66492.1 HAMP domain-containing protein [Streptomyces sp. SID8373]RAJ67984.1 two-component system OmpR family sensor kinase [Streptomyces sp. KhCrAH-43]